MKAHKQDRRQFIRYFSAVPLVGIGLLSTISRSAVAQFFDQPITLVSPFAPGGSTDLVARAISQPLSQALGVPVVVEDRLGASGMIATHQVARSTPDGRALLITTSSTVVVLPHTNDTIPYDAQKDLVGITLLGITPEVLAINPKTAAHNLKELIEIAKKRQVTLSSSGNGGLPHLVIELLKSTVPEANILHVPYKAASPAVVDTVAGHVDGVFVDLPAVYKQIKGGTLRGIAVADKKRSVFLPDLPTTVEQGYHEVIGVNWTGVLVPTGTPQALIDKVFMTLTEVMKRPEVKMAMDASAVEVSLSASPAAFKDFMATEYENWRMVVQKSGIKATH